MSKHNVTRGYGFFETFLAKKRAEIAEKFITNSHRKGKILDIGCGTNPFFLLNIDFSKKYGIDQVAPKISKAINGQRIHFKKLDIDKENMLPFKNESFDVVTMLAVLEHLELATCTKILNEIYRIMKPGGVYILTTPAAWTEYILKILAMLKMVSSEEIEEHKNTFTHKKICSTLQKGGFAKEKMRLGYFELFMNLYAIASK